LFLIAERMPFSGPLSGSFNCWSMHVQTYRPDYRSDYRSDYRPDYRPNYRPDYRSNYRPDYRSNYIFVGIQVDVPV
jgi:hypothetical protein